MNEYTDDEVHRSCEIGRWVEQRRKVNDAIESEVKCARMEGMSWAKIGLALGTSAQSAWERYGLTGEQRRERMTAHSKQWTQEEFALDADLSMPTSDGL